MAKPWFRLSGKQFGAESVFLTIYPKLLTLICKKLYNLL